MLDDAGVAHRVVPAAIDERAIAAGLSAAADIALRLADAKAIGVGRDYPGEWVVGSDSVVSVDGRLFDKPRSRDEAAEHLRVFSGRTLELTSAVALAEGAALSWSQADSAELAVRRLSKAFIDDYLDAEWPAIGQCVGVFRLEGRGVQLFERIEGSHFTILGMPLLPLLGALRDRGVISG